MIDVNEVRMILQQLGILGFVGAGCCLMLSGLARGARRWAGRLALLGLLFAIVAGLVTPEWLP